MSDFSKAPVICVDGPSGAGKGTLCRLLADETGYHLLDSGALYRITALAGMRSGGDLSSAEAMANIAKELDVEFATGDKGVAIRLSDEDVTAAVRDEKTGMGASVVAAHDAVREALLERQRKFAQLPGLIADGRDMGTVVFPSAQLKVFLTASAEERAKRRVLQIEQGGKQAEYEVILADIQARDDRDSNRSTAPLKPAEDAIMLDSTSMTIDQVLSAVLALAKDRNLIS